MVNKTIKLNKNTYNSYLKYLYHTLKIEKDKILKLEKMNFYISLPYLVTFLENNKINFNEAVNYFNYKSMNTSYLNLLKITIIGCFNKLEKGDNNYDVF